MIRKARKTTGSDLRCSKPLVLFHDIHDIFEASPLVEVQSLQHGLVNIPVIP